MLSIEETMLRLEFVEALTKVLPTAPSFTLTEKEATIQSFIDKHSGKHAGHAILLDAGSQVR